MDEGLYEMTGRQQNSLALILFSPRKPRFRRRVRGSQGVFSRRMSGKRRIFYFDEETTFACSQSSRSCFLFVQLFRSQGTFSRSENEFIIKKCVALLWRKRIYYKKVRGVALAKTEHIIKKLRYIVSLRRNATQFVLEEKL